MTSRSAEFGDNVAYLVLAAPDRRSGWARREPLAENFQVWVDLDGVARTDHALDLGTVPVIRLHYRIDRATPYPRPHSERSRHGYRLCLRISA